MSGETEVLTVELKLPKAILDLLRALRVNINEYFQNTIVEGLAADLDAGSLWDDVLERFPEIKHFLEDEGGQER
ncbi:MAG: hypothetical protein QXD19_00145 [Candidatus Bathyarchaeia archaeon]